MKHFNSAIIWGRLTSFKVEMTRYEKPYLVVTVECNSRQYGNVLAFCHIWSPAKVEEFQAAFKAGDTVYLKGFFAQYTTNRNNRKKVKTNFNITEFSPWNPEEDQHKTPRAVFILLGRVLSCDTVEGDERLMLSIERENESTEFEFFVTAENMLDIGYTPEVGCTARVKGVIAVEIDKFGDITKGPRPVIEQVKVEGAPEGADVPF